MHLIHQNCKDFMEIQKTLGFTMPERSAAPAGSMLLNPKEVSSWLSGLPMANVGETSRQVFKTLVEFNRIDIPNLNRIKIAELLRRPIGYISDNLRKYYYDASFPLSAKNRKIAVLNRELYTELALAYKIFIDTTLSGDSGKIDRKMLIIAIHRAMRYLFTVVYQSVIVYDPVPPQVWKEIHRLYAYAEQHRIHELAVKDGQRRDSVSSIASLYKQTLLFSICSPYRMRPRKIENVAQSLEHWSRLTTLDNQTGEAPGQYDFVANLASDAPPRHSSLETSQEIRLCRVLNTQPLVKTLRETFEQLPQDSGNSEGNRSDPKLSKQLLRQLIHILSSAPKREFVRTRLNFELKVAVGINAIHALQTQEGAGEHTTGQRTGSNTDWIDESTGNTPNQSLYTVSGNNLTLEGYDDAIQETIIASGFGESGCGQDGTPIWATRSTDQQYETFACKTDNESAGGYCINWQGANAPKIKIGEVIGIQSATVRNQFAIGISRWMKNLPGQGLQLGMQMIAPNATAVLVHDLEANNPASHAQKCLLLPELKASELPASLILPTLPFKAGDLVMIEREGHERKAKLTQLVETTGAFARFHFNYLDARPGDGDPADFDNIWPML